MPFLLDSKINIGLEMKTILARLNEIFNNMITETQNFIKDNKERRSREKRLSKSEWKNFLSKEEDNRNRSLSHIDVCIESLAVINKFLSTSEITKSDISYRTAEIILNDKNIRQNILELIRVHPSEQIVKEGIEVLRRIKSNKSQEFISKYCGDDTSIVDILADCFKMALSNENTQTQIFGMTKEVFIDLLGMSFDGQQQILSFFEKLKTFSKKMMVNL